MLSRVSRGPLAVLAGLALVACSSDKPPAADAGAADTPAAAAAAPNVVTVVTTNYAFDAPAELPAGLTTFRLVNRGPSLHHIQLVQLGEGKTVDDFMAALKAGPPPKWARMAGGPNPGELGDTTITTLALEPGNYAMLCFIPDPDGVPHVAKGMVRPLTVTTAAAGPAAASPEADVVMKLVDYDFELSKPIPAGRHTIRIENAGPQEHEVAIVKLEPGKQPMDFARWGEKQVGKPPGTLHGGVSGIMPGDTAFVEVDLAPGEYGLICFVPDHKDGKGHYHHGMAKKVTVS